MKQKIKEGMFTKYGERKKLRFEGDWKLEFYVNN